MAGFFDKVKNTVNKGVVSVGANSKAMLEKTKINMSISKLDNEYQDLLRRLGQLTFDKIKNQSISLADDDIANLVKLIDNKLDEIAKLREQIQHVEEELNDATSGREYVYQEPVTCYECGYLNQPDTDTCKGCNKPIK